jgi:nucleotide-binding universal stress UspA family protein
MSFLRRSERRPGLLTYERILVPLAGHDVDDLALRLTVALLAGTQGQASLLHVIEVPFERQLDVEDEDAMARAEQVLERGEAFLREHGVTARTSMVQARVAGAAIVDDAVELGAELILMGLPYKKRLGGQWDAGRTVPYVMRNSTAPVWCLRAETQELAHTP